MVEPQKALLLVNPAKVHLIQRILREIPNDIPSNTTAVLTQTLCLPLNMAGEEALNRLPNLLLHGRNLEALIVCGNAIHNLIGRKARSALRPLVIELQKLLQDELLCRGGLDLIENGHPIHLLPRRSVLIGRSSTEAPVDIAVNCMWLSRGDRQLGLVCKGATWFIEDLGSTNGSYVNGQPLKPGHQMPLGFGDTRIDVGATPDQAAPVTVHFYRPDADPSAIVVRLSCNARSNELIARAWPTAQSDFERRWIVFREQLGISAEQDSAIRISGVKQGIVAAIRYQQGFWIVPAQDCEVLVNDERILGPLPLVPEAKLALEGFPLRVGQQAKRQLVSHETDHDCTV